MTSGLLRIGMNLLQKRGEFQCRFCALGYRPDSRNESPSLEGQIILIGIESPTAGYRLLIDPRWEELVFPEDRSYFSALLQDLKERVRIDPGGLFKQLISLSVGPLVVNETGSSIEDNPRLWKLASAFEEL